MTDPADLVSQFHATYGVPVRRGRPSVDLERVHLRMALIAEEFAELVGAVYGEAAQDRVAGAFAEARALDAGRRDVVEAADALGDLVYVIYGMALECGIPLPRVLEEIQASNLSKLGAGGEVLLREDGKVLKGPNYFRPRIDRVLAEAGE